MNQPDLNSGTQRPVLRITKEQANSSHVDDLLKRQMSLRGELGIARESNGHWYMQNWFTFMLVGGLFAFIAWAIMEPFYDDHIYIQGTVTKIVAAPNDAEDSDFREVHLDNGQVIMLSAQTPTTQKESTVDDLRIEQQAGFYVEWLPELGEKISYAVNVELNPPAQTPADADQSLNAISARHQAISMFIFPLVAAMIGLGIGATDGIACRLVRRALLAGAVGLIIGLLGGFVSSVIANIVYTPLTELASRQSGDAIGSFSTSGFLVQMGGRSLAWAFAGVAMGLGQGMAMRSSKLALYGLIGGILGGLIGGLLFDPVHFLIVSEHNPSAHWSRMIGFTIIGLTVGAMIGIVELLGRDAWFCMTKGPLAGKEFLVFKNTMRMGCSPRSDIYLFNDPGVTDHHAILRANGGSYEIEGMDPTYPITVNGRVIKRSRLRHGDQVGLGSTLFTFNCKANNN